MKRVFFCLLTLGVIIGCICYTSNNDKCIHKLLKEIGVPETDIERITHLVIIPEYGCKRCIDKAQSRIHASLNTIYVVVCPSKKNFFLLTNRHLEDFSNVFIDKNATSVEMKMVETIPLVYELEKGKFISRKPYLQDNPEENDGIVPQTKVAFDKTSVDWKQIDFGKMQQTSFTLTNIGDEDLRITNVELSCECLETSYIKRIVPPGDTLHLDIRFYPDITGAFVRDVFVYGNFLSSPMELSLKGVSVAQ